MADRENLKEIIDGLRCATGDPMPCAKCRYRGYMYSICKRKCAEDAIALLKAQEPVKPILARGWYWCGGVGCRNSLTSAFDDDSPALKPNYCEKCGRAVKWE